MAQGPRRSVSDQAVQEDHPIDNGERRRDESLRRGGHDVQGQCERRHRGLKFQVSQALCHRRRKRTTSAIARPRSSKSSRCASLAATKRTGKGRHRRRPLGDEGTMAGSAAVATLIAPTGAMPTGLSMPACINGSRNKRQLFQQERRSAHGCWRSVGLSRGGMWFNSGRSLSRTTSCTWRAGCRGGM